MDEGTPVDPYAPSANTQAIFAVLGAALQRTDSPLVDSGKQLADLLKAQVTQGTPLGKAAVAFLDNLRNVEDPALKQVDAQARMMVHTLATTVLTLAQS